MIELADLLVAMAPAGARLAGPPVATRFEGFAYDSRKLRPGELFLAVRTARADGHDYIDDAIQQGAAGVIAERWPASTSFAGPGPTAIVVSDTLLALRSWARYVLERYAPRVVGVVGPIGKTLAAKAAVTVVGAGFAGDPAIFDGNNHNTVYGLSIALGRLTALHRVAVLELARDEPGSLLDLAELTRPSVGLVVGAYGDEAADRELVEFVTRLPPTGRLVVNGDDPILAEILDRAAERCQAPLVRYRRSPAADVWATDEDYQIDHSRLVVHFRSGMSSELRLGLIGQPGVAGALAGAAVGVALGYHPDEIVASLERLVPVPGRLCPLAGQKGSRILDDSFAASPAGLVAGLAVLERAPGPKVVVVGDLTGPGREVPAEEHARLGHAVARRADHLVTLGEAAEALGLAALAAGMPAERVVLTDSVHDAAEATLRMLGPTTVALVAGGADARLERVVERLLAEPARAADLLVRQDAGWKQRVFLSRERPTWVEVDLAAIGENVRRLKEIVQPAALMAVLKADGYGHGAVRVARTALLHGADYLATACLSEALALRRHGITAPILILGYTPPWQAEEIVRHDLTATVFSLEPVRHLARAAHTLRRSPARVQIKVDTGMGRLGLLPAEVPAFVETVRAMAGVEVEGLFTHFASADAPDPSATYRQIERFEAVLDAVGRDGWRPRYVHAANSAGLLRFPEARYSMVRAGIALYGLDPSDIVRLPSGFRPGLTFKTLVAQVKELPPASPISYGGTFVTARPSRIAVLPVGYGDGFRRSPRNWREVLIRGRRAPIVGVVCMDMCMIDVTDVPGVRVGDEVVLIGRQHDDEITVAEVAERLGTIPYEVITQILARVPREVSPEA